MNVVMLRRELEIMSILDHPNIVKLYETYEDELYVNIVIEYCEGGDVAERILNNGNFSEKEASFIMQKLLGAVNYLHLHKISHRDLKAENFLYETLDPNSEIKIADFGMSSKFGNNLRMQSLAGTPYYLAPEIVKGSYTKSCDIWSLGVFLYFILSGSHPFLGNNFDDVFEKSSSGMLNFSGKEWQKISNNGIDLISNMLVPDPRKRISIKKALAHPWFKSFKTVNPEPIPFYIFNSLKQYKSQNKLWQEALKVIVKVLSNKQISELKKWFIKIDSNNSGCINSYELAEAMKLSGYQIAEDEINEIIKNYDNLGEGKINYTDFLIATLDKKNLLDEEILWQAFKYFDVDNDGVISIENIKEVLERSGAHLKDSEIESILSTSQMKSFENSTFENFKAMIIANNILDDNDLKKSDSAISKLVRQITVEIQRLSS